MAIFLSFKQDVLKPVNMKRKDPNAAFHALAHGNQTTLFGAKGEKEKKKEEI